MLRAVVVAIVGVAGAVPAGAAVRGTFANKDVKVQVVDGVAYERKAEFGDAMAVRVALSAAPLDAKAIAAALDVEQAVAVQRSGPSVDLEFAADGSWSGMTYMLGPGNGCGWCSDSKAGAKSTVKVVNGALRGTLRVAAADYGDGEGPAMDLTFDLPVVKITATALPADGGDPGKALLACRKAAKARDRAAAQACLDPGAEGMAAAAEGSDEGFWYTVSMYGDSLLMPTLTITGGRAKGEWAEVRIEGKDEQGQQKKGGVFLRLLPAGWRYHHEALENVY
jgi:hypothetical protein